MSIFTTYLKNILVEEGGSYAIVDGRMIVDKPEIIGLGHYPIFDEAHRETLNGLIFGTYMNREIGSETYEMWLVDIITHMNLNMPYFNKMYEAELLLDNPLSTVDLQTESSTETEQSGESIGTSTTETSADSKSRAVTSETPQSMLAGNADYASNAADSSSVTSNEATGRETGETSSTGTGTSETRTHGYQGHAVELVNRYRQTLVSVDQMVISSLEPFFMGILSAPNRIFSERY